MKKALITLGLLMAFGCKGPVGDKGDSGAQGLRGPIGNTGPTQVAILTGAVSSDDFTVFDPRITSSSGFLVYGEIAGGNLIELPIFNSSGGYNVLYIARTGQIEIFNAQKSGFIAYAITLVIG